MIQLRYLTYFSRKVKIFAAQGAAYHYTYGRWRLNRWLSRGVVKFDQLDDQTFLAQLKLDRPELSQVKKAVLAGNYQEAKFRLATYFRARTVPRFFFSSEDMPQILALVDSTQQKATLHAADEICQNIFRFRRMDAVRFERAVDWTYCPHGNTDWTWDLNRHTYFETLGRAYCYTGNERYAQKFKELLLDWLSRNPAGVDQPNWTSVFEVAFRVNTWLWAFYYFRAASAFDQETCSAFLKGLLMHGHYLDANLELHVRNNHLLLEAKALVMLGGLFPEFKNAEKWQQRGLEILYQQVATQVGADGVHGELTTHYHRVITGELLELLVLLENNNITIPTAIRETFARMVEFELWVTRPDGLIPLLGDSAWQDTHQRISAASGGPIFLKRSEFKSIAPLPDEANLWLLGPARVRSYQNLPAPAFDLSSRAFPEGGYFIMRSGRGTEAAYLVFDCGPFGYRLDPNHGHADALSLELYAAGQALLVDPGVYSTHLGWDWRRFFRGSRAHNVIVVDEEDQSILLDSRRVYRAAKATLHQWLSNDSFDFVDGSHDGYTRLPEPIIHRRQVFFVKPEYWVVIDLLTGQGRHCFDLYFHLMPNVETHLEPTSGLLRTSNGLAIVSLTAEDLQAELFTGVTAPIQGWVSFFSGERLPAPTLRYRREATAPVQFCTVLYPYGQNNLSLTVSTPAVEIVNTNEAADHCLTKLQLETSTYIDYLLIDRAESKRVKRFADLESDATLIFVRRRKKDNGVVKVFMQGGSDFLNQGQSLLQNKQFVDSFILETE